MTISLISVVVLVAVAGVCGGIGRALFGGTGRGFLASVALGFVGGLLGAFIAERLNLPDLLTVSIDGHRFPLAWSVAGSGLVVAMLHLLFGATAPASSNR